MGMLPYRPLLSLYVSAWENLLKLPKHIYLGRFILVWPIYCYEVTVCMGKSTQMDKTHISREIYFSIANILL